MVLIIYIARCHVVVKFYRDLYFGYSPIIIAAGIGLIQIFKFYHGKTTPETDKAVKVNATAVVNLLASCSLCQLANNFN